MCPTITHPRQVGQPASGPAVSHPQRACRCRAGKLVVVTDEQVADGPHARQRAIRVVDVLRREARRSWRSARTRTASIDLPTALRRATTCTRTGPGPYRSERARVRDLLSALACAFYDLADAGHPVEVAHWVPEAPRGQPVAQINDLFVDGRRADLGHRPDRRRPLRPGTRAGPWPALMEQSRT